MKDAVKVLYVDDEKINLFIFQKLLQKKFEVITASSGEEGLKILEEDSSIQNIISDRMMPGLSGLEFIRKAKEKFADKNYFILSGFSIDQEIQDALNSGLIHHYWTKPAKFELIQAAILKTNSLEE